MQRIGVALAGLIVGIGSMIAIAFLVSGRKHLSLRDGLVVMGVLLAAAGHVATAAAALLGRLRWPIRNRELASLVLFAASVSIVACVIGATTAAEPTAKRVVRGVEVTGVMEFVLAATLFTIPGWTLLVLRLVAFCPSDHAFGGSTVGCSRR